jgi:hypothetical protein
MLAHSIFGIHAGLLYYLLIVLNKTRFRLAVISFTVGEVWRAADNYPGPSTPPRLGVCRGGASQTPAKTVKLARTLY